MRFSVQINEPAGEVSAKTRASADQWAKGDPIGVYAFENGTEAPVQVSVSIEEWKKLDSLPGITW